MRAVRLAKESGVALAVEATGFSRASIYRWVRAFDERGVTALLEDSRRPQRMRVTVPSWVDTVIIAIRLHTYWNSKRIAAEMERRQIYRVSAKHIDQLFQRHGCSRGAVPQQPGPRYERSRPNELWHIDIKGPFFISVEGSGYLKTWIVGLVDDHSRFVLGLRIHTDAKLAPLLEWLDDCFELWGQPIELMSDNGSPSSAFCLVCYPPASAAVWPSAASATFELRSAHLGPTARSRLSGRYSSARSWTANALSAWSKPKSPSPALPSTTTTTA
jgi:hypothetical protein